MSEIVRNNELEGDLSVGRHVALGGNLKVQGGAEVDHSLRVGGSVAAQSVSGPWYDMLLRQIREARLENQGEIGDILEIVRALGDRVDEEVARRPIKVIGTTDADPETDLNVYSAKRTKREFLSRTHEDTAYGRIDFASGFSSQALSQLLGGVQFGSFLSGMYGGYGGAIDSRGNAEVESLRVRSTMEVMELVVNRLSAIEGDQLLTESDIIEEVINLGGGRYGLRLQSKYEGYFTAQAEDNVLRGTVNNVYEAALMGVPLKYYTSWMRINMVNTAGNYIEVTLYPDDQVPAGRNFSPCPLMRIARWGNQTDETRQTCIVLSTTERRILFYQHVTKPIIEDANIGMCLGKAPDFLKAKNQINDSQNYLYVKGIFTEGVYEVDMLGFPQCEYVNRGPWQSGKHYCYRHQNPETGRWEISLVYHKGCQWQCMVDGTQAEPSFSTTDWVMVMGDDSFRIEFEEPVQVFELKSFDTTLTVRAYIGWNEVTDELLDGNVQWTRYTEDSEGNQRIASDNLWSAEHGLDGKQLHLTVADLGIDSSGMPKKIVFTATATLTEGSTATAQFIYE